jgi:hypothetical protein
MVWKTTMGETARLQTAMIEREMPKRSGIELSLIEKPMDTMILGKRYTLKCKLINHKSRATDIRVRFGATKMDGIAVCGKSSLIFNGVKGSGGSIEFNVDVTSLEAGLQIFGGGSNSIILDDMLGGQSTPVGVLASVFVVVKEVEKR